MKVYEYILTMDGGTQVITEDEILDQYYDYWCSRMREVGKEDEISETLCIQDWVMLHYATEVTIPV
jgi:hypothetical protein